MKLKEIDYQEPNWVLNWSIYKEKTQIPESYTSRKSKDVSEIVISKGNVDLLMSQFNYTDMIRTDQKQTKLQVYIKIRNYKHRFQYQQNIKFISQGMLQTQQLFSLGN